MKNRTAALAIAASIVVASATSATAAARLITGAQIKNGTITTVDLKNSGVRSVDLAAGSVTTSDIATGGVTSTDIANGSITTTDLAPATAQTLIDAAADAVPVAPVEIGAHAIIDAPNSVVLAGTAKNVTGVARAATGIYCVSVSDVDLSHATAIATMDSEYSLPAGAIAVGPNMVQRGEAGSVAVAADTSRCPRTIEIRTFRQISGNMVLDDSVAFSIAVA